jgi:hypothetical protein
LKFVLIAIVAFSAFSFVIMSLWNRLIKILFGGFRPRFGPGMHWRRRMMERWEQMSPEERQKFREGMRGRCGPVGTPASEQKA